MITDIHEVIIVYPLTNQNHNMQTTAKQKSEVESGKPSDGAQILQREIILWCVAVKYWPAE